MFRPAAKLSLMLLAALVVSASCGELPGRGSFLPENAAYLAGQPAAANDWPQQSAPAYQPPAGDFQAPPAPGSYLPSEPSAPVRYQGDEFGGAPGQQQQLQQQTGEGRRSRLGNLRQLAHSLGSSSRRAIQEAQPALQGIKGDLTETVNRVRHHPRVVQGLIYAKPHIEALKKSAQPVVNRGGKLIAGLAQRAANAGHNRGHNAPANGPADGLPVPVAPPAAHDVYEQGSFGPPAAHNDVAGAGRSKYDF